MIVLRQGHLELRFPDGSGAIQWDRHPAYLDGLANHPTTTAVDVCFLDDSERPCLLEVTNYRDKKVPTERVCREVVEKTRDTIAALVWACERNLAPGIERLTKRVLDAAGSRELRVIAWIDADRPPDAADAAFFRDEIARGLRPWLIASVEVTNRGIQADPKHAVDGFDFSLVARPTR